MEQTLERPTRMRLYNCNNERLYVNAVERARILKQANGRDPKVRAFCLTLLYTGCRISEALELRHGDVQLEARVMTFRTLKRRSPGVYREVPMSRDLVYAIEDLHQTDGQRTEHVWSDIDRITAYRWIKGVMQSAGVEGAQACPKGLRHGYGIAAAMASVPITILQKWMGHASITTTAIYTDAVGPEQLAIADRMWR